MKTNIIYFLIVLFILCPACKKEPKVQPLWFPATLSTSGTLKRALTLFPPNTKAYFVINSKSLKKEKELSSIVQVVGQKLPINKNPDSPLNLKSLFQLSLDLMIVGLVTNENKGDNSIIALAIGNFNTLDIVQTLQQAASNSGTKLITTRKKEMTLYTLQEDPLWGVLIASKELILLGNASQLTAIASKYVLKKPPDLLSVPFNVEETSDPLFAWIRPGLGDKSRDIQEIWVNVQKGKVWEAKLTFVAENEEKASTVASYLKANQIMARNLKGRGAKLVKLLIKANLSQKENKVTLSWPLADIPWKDLADELVPTKTSEDD